MGDRFFLEVTCPKCGFHDDDVYYAPTSDFIDWTCDGCGHVVDLEELTGISYEDASNPNIMVNTMNNYTRDSAKLSVGPGWSKIIDEIFDKLPSDAFITQVKEKFGGLRFYVDGVDSDFYDFIQGMEEKSLTICEMCGQPGKPITDRGWIKTRCENHTEE